MQKFECRLRLRLNAKTSEFLATLFLTGFTVEISYPAARSGTYLVHMSKPIFATQLAIKLFTLIFHRYWYMISIMTGRNLSKSSTIKMTRLQ